jgi:hypothetical protein
MKFVESSINTSSYEADTWTSLVPEGSLPYSQSCNGSYSESAESTPQSDIFLLKVNFDITLPSMPRSSNYFIDFSCSN